MLPLFFLLRRQTWPPRLAAVATCGFMPRGRCCRCSRLHLALVHLGQRALVFVREHLDELRRDAAQSSSSSRARWLPVQRLCSSSSFFSSASSAWSLCQIASCSRLLLGGGAAPRPATPWPCCSGWRTGRPRRTRRRCRRDMPAAKLRPVLPSTTHRAAGHVFAAMVARAFDHRRGARQAHRESLAGHAAEDTPRRWSRRTAPCCR